MSSAFPSTRIRGFPPALDQRVEGAQESYWGGLVLLFDNGLLLRLEGGGNRPAGSYWTFGVFLDVGGNPLRPAYSDVQKWMGQHRSSHGRAYLTPRRADPLTRASFDALAGRLGAKWVALILMERKPELVIGPADARWTIDARFFARSPVESTASAIALCLDLLVDELDRCSAGCFATKIRGR